jgi:hypothetical protein
LQNFIICLNEKDLQTYCFQSLYLHNSIRHWFLILYNFTNEFYNFPGFPKIIGMAVKFDGRALTTLAGTLTGVTRTNKPQPPHFLQLASCFEVCDLTNAALMMI